MDDAGIFLVLIVALFINGMIGNFIGRSVDKPAPGFWFGFLLGPIGWIIVLLLPRNEETIAKQSRGAGGSSTLAASKWTDISSTTDPIKLAAFVDAFPGSEEAFLASQRKHQLDHWRRVDQTDADVLANLFSDTEFDGVREEIRATIAKNASANEPMERLHREILDKEAAAPPSAAAAAAAMRERERQAAEKEADDRASAHARIFVWVVLVAVAIGCVRILARP